MGFDLTETLRRAVIELDESAWRPALRQDGEPRDGAWVAEITDRLELTGWPAGSRVIVRRERPHPGAQLSFTDHDGHRCRIELDDEGANEVKRKVKPKTVACAVKGVYASLWNKRAIEERCA